MANLTEAAIGAVETIEAVPTGDQPTLTDVKYTEQLVGEGKKYTDYEALAKAYVNADIHINELRDKLDDNERQEVMMQEVLARLRDTSIEPVNPDPVTPITPASDNASQITSDDVVKTVRETLDEAKSVDKAKANTDKALQLLNEHFGSQEAVLRAIKSVHKEDVDLRKVIDELAAVDPVAAVQFIVGSNTQAPSGPSAPGVSGGPSADAIVSSQGGLTWTMARKIKEEDPKKYKSKEFRAALEVAAADAESRGEDFFAT